MRKNVWRKITAAAVLAAFVAVLATMAPAYVQNFRLRHALSELVRQPELANSPPEVVQVATANRAASLGIPVRPEHVRVSRFGNSLHVEVRYRVRVDVFLYTVDLRFSAGSGAR